MSNTVVFAGGGGKITVRILGYELPAASDVDDANWVSAEILAEAGPFRGTFRSSLMTTELIGLCRDLEKATESLSGKVSFKTLESDLELTVSFGHRGAAEITGFLRPGGWSPGVLHFQFQSDQSYLSSSVQDLRNLTRQFPFREVPGL